jgi:hypothetical protein
MGGRIVLPYWTSPLPLYIALPATVETGAGGNVVV